MFNPNSDRNDWAKFLETKVGNAVNLAIMNNAEGVLTLLCHEEIPLDWDRALILAYLHLTQSSIEVQHRVLGKIVQQCLRIRGRRVKGPLARSKYADRIGITMTR